MLRTAQEIHIRELVGSEAKSLVLFQINSQLKVYTMSIHSYSGRVLQCMSLLRLGYHLIIARYDDSTVSATEISSLD